MPLFFVFLNTHGTLSVVFLALAGAALLSSFSVTVIAAQETIPNNKAMAAGLTIGFAGGIGGLLAGLIGMFMKSRPAARMQRMMAR